MFCSTAYSGHGDENKRTVIKQHQRGNTAQPLAMTTSRKPATLLSDHYSIIPKVSQSNHYIWSLLQATTSRERPQPPLELKV